MESCENRIVPPPFPLDYRNLNRYLPKEPDDQPLDFTVKKQQPQVVSNSRNGFGDSIMRPTSPLSESSVGSESPEQQQQQRLDFAKRLDHLRLIHPYAGVDPAAAIPFLPMSFLGLPALPPVLRESNLQSSSTVQSSSGKKGSSKRKSSKPKDLRPHQVAEKLIQQPIHRPRNIFQNGSFSSPDSVPSTLSNGVFSRRSGLDAAASLFSKGDDRLLSYNGGSLTYHGGSSVADRVQYGYSGCSPFAYGLSTAYNGLPSANVGVSPLNDRSSPRNGLPSAHLSSPERASSPSRHQSPTSPKGDHGSSFNGSASTLNGLSPSKPGVTSPYNGLKADLTSSTAPHDGLSSSKVGVTSSQSALSSPKGDLSSPHNGLSLSNVGVTSSQNGLSSPKGDLSSPHNGLSLSNIGVTSSQNGMSSPKGDQTSSYNGLSSPDGTTGQSIYLDRSQEKIDPSSFSSPEDTNGRLSPLSSSEMGRSSPITSSDVVDSSSGVGCKRKKGNPVPESAKDLAYILKRHKNNMAAKKSREKRRVYETTLSKKVDALLATNVELKAENDRLYFEREERLAHLWRLEQQLEAERVARVRAEAQLSRSCGRCSDPSRA